MEFHTAIVSVLLRRNNGIVLRPSFSFTMIASRVAVMETISLISYTFLDNARDFFKVLRSGVGWMGFGQGDACLPSNPCMRKAH